MPDLPIWIPSTKFWPPVLHAELLARSRLQEMIRSALANYKLTLLLAPAGSGKTTLLAEAATGHSSADLPVAWLTLNEDDNDPARFLLALVGAIQRQHPTFESRVPTLLTDLETPALDVRRLVAVLINDIVRQLSMACAFVLDDLHLITNPHIYAGLDYLLDHLPPQLHLAFATRYSPPLALSRLRARRQLAEVLLEDLRFTDDEIAEFLNGVVGLDLTPDQLRVFQQRIDGWPVGVSLLALSLQRGEPSSARDTFAAALARTDRSLFEFLADEVLEQHEPDLRTFLVQTSILPVLTPTLCAAVSGRHDAAQLLEQSYRRNLFLNAVDAAATAFRFHELFRTFLQARLERDTPMLLRELHRRAAAAETNAAQAIRHALAAEQWDDAAARIEQAADEFVAQGTLLLLRQWIEALPRELLERRPRLAYFLGVCAWERWELDRATAWFEQAAQGFAAAGNAQGLGEALTYLAGSRSTMGDIAGSRAAAEQAIAQPLPLRHRAQLVSVRAWYNLADGGWQAALADLDAALTLAEASADQRALRILASHIHSPIGVLPGGVELLERFIRVLDAQLPGQDTPLRAAGEQLKAFVQLWRGNWAAAIAHGEQALALSDQFGGLLWVDGDAGALLPACRALQRDSSGADAGFARLFDLLGQPAAAAYTAGWLALYLGLYGRLQWLHGQLEAARATYARMCASANAQEWPSAPAMRALLLGLLELADGRYAGAESALLQAVTIQQRLRFTSFAGDAQLLLAYLYLRWARPKQALVLLEPVLNECQQQQAPGRLLWQGADVARPLLRLAVEHNLAADFARRTLDRVDGSMQSIAAGLPPITIPEIESILTPREIEILQLIASGADNPTIAARLVISLHTVKTHVAHILAKLGVASRTEAAVRARDLGMR